MDQRSEACCLWQSKQWKWALCGAAPSLVMAPSLLRSGPCWCFRTMVSLTQELKADAGLQVGVVGPGSGDE